MKNFKSYLIIFNLVFYLNFNTNTNTDSSSIDSIYNEIIKGINQPNDSSKDYRIVDNIESSYPKSYIDTNSHIKNQLNYKKLHKYITHSNVNQTNKQNSLEEDICVRKEGLLKIRDVDSKTADVNVVFAVLTKKRITYYMNPRDEKSIIGSVELKNLNGDINNVKGFNTCFYVKGSLAIYDLTICSESVGSKEDWVDAFTKNIVNCNQK
eukprot:Mrub_09589.p1 GENE.Mrub_09589~~Mrub_09589.p1  ORF type:complete len:209 (+),score=31.02 Mrub_09589:35-661(+)